MGLRRLIENYFLVTENTCFYAAFEKVFNFCTKKRAPAVSAIPPSPVQAWKASPQPGFRLRKPVGQQKARQKRQRQNQQKQKGTFNFFDRKGK